jgi:hypothetical protein
MSFNIQAGGPQTILNSSSTGAGNWYRVHPQIRNITFQAVATGASATIGSTVLVQGSNDGINAVASTLATIALNSTSTVASDGFVLDAHWEYVRAQINSLTTGSLQVIACAQIINQ